MKRKDYLYLSILTIIPLLLILATMNANQLFGYKIDWLSQHTAIPDYFRQLFYQSGNLFPDYAPHIGSGMNIYALSYYGLFRIDVLIAYALPFIAMKDIIIFYMIFLIILSSILNYIWLKKHHYSSTICFVCSIILISSSLFFQAHRQIMFVNYIPFLILALMSIDYLINKNKISYLIISILLIILHSYFFSISAIVVCIIYYIYQIDIINKKHIIKFISAIFIAIMIASILLIPTALVILENTKDVSTSSFDQILGMNLNLKGLLYSGYGCGFTMIAYISIVLSLFQKKTKYFAITLFICFIFPFISYLLNGTLYARTKILITFIPLVILLIASVLQNLKKRTIIYHPLMIFLLLFPILFINNKFVAIDLILTIFILFIYHKYSNKYILLLCIIPLVYLSSTNTPSTYLNQNKYNDDAIKEQLLTSNTLKGRSDDLSEPLANTNHVYTMKQYKSSSYTSTTNTLYNQFYFDIMHNPISNMNRVAQPSKANIIFQNYMGINTLLSKNIIPIGYQIKDKKKNYKLLQNNNTLPIAYASDAFINKKTYDKLSYPYTLDTIFNNSIVEEKGNSNYQSQMKKIKLDCTINNQSKNLSITKDKNKYKIIAKKKETLLLNLNNDLNNKILLINFNLKDITKKESRDTSIKINGVLNKLSKDNAPYPNHNNQFTYILSNQKAIKQLEIEFSKGSYTIDHLQIHTLDYLNLVERKNQVIALSLNPTKDKELLNGTIKTINQSYFITTLPYQKGYHVYVDGKEIDIELVNKAFIGFKLQPGKHHIIVSFSAPGKQIGMVFTLLGISLLILIFGLERNKKDEK